MQGVQCRESSAGGLFFSDLAAHVRSKAIDPWRMSPAWVARGTIPWVPYCVGVSIRYSKGFLVDSGTNSLHYNASVAQLAEQLICNQQVVGSSPSASSLANAAVVLLLTASVEKKSFALVIGATERNRCKRARGVSRAVKGVRL